MMDTIEKKAKGLLKAVHTQAGNYNAQLSAELASQIEQY